MTIVEMLTRYPYLFYSQQWYRGEAFTRILPTEVPPYPPDDVSLIGKTPPKNARLYHAVDLLNAFIKAPEHPIWQKYLWCKDFDEKGQQVFVGGFANTGAMEIHRHLQLTERFGVPVWKAA